MMLARVSLAVLLALFIQAFSFVGETTAHYWSQQSAIAEIKQRISLDIASLDLGAENAQSVPDENEIQRYLANLNLYLDTQGFPVRVLSLATISLPTNIEEQNFFNTYYDVDLSANERAISIRLAAPSIYTPLSISYLALLFFAAFIGIKFLKQDSVPTNTQVSKKRQTKKTRRNDSPNLVLTIDLKKKALYLQDGHKKQYESNAVVLSNKPFCFYVAIIRFCLSEQANLLVHQSKLPDKLLAFADETFKQLMELGHTKRKQPDFSSNLDKTLSEIRAALDEVFAEYPKEKALYYPPKAQGEGSRTKKHSFGLEQLNESYVKIVA